jgi:SAM-dependent methyltransferase
MNHEAERVFAGMVAVEKAYTSGIDSRHRYLEMHERRFAEICALCRTLTPNSSARVLDVGRSELTVYLSSFYRNVQTLGLDPLTDDGGHRETRELNAIPHITFDLLDAPRVGDWPECGTFDLVIFSEVIEHLHVSPVYVLAFLSTLLSPGGVLFCTTPNATEISKRIRMLGGQNPYEQLRLYSRNPGHVREYTKKELVAIGASVGLDCLSHSYNDWIRHNNTSSIKRVARQLLYAYPAFRPFQTLVFARGRGSKAQ